MSVEGTNNVVQNFSKFEKNLVAALVQVVQISFAKIANDAAQNHPYRTRTGLLNQAIAASPLSGVVRIDDKEITGTIQVNRDYASYVEFGYDKGRLHKDYSFMRPAIKREQPFFVARARAAVKGTRP